MTIKNNVVPMTRRISRDHFELRKAAFVSHCDMAAQHMRHGDEILAGLQLQTALKILDEPHPEMGGSERRASGPPNVPAPASDDSPNGAA